MQPLSLLGPIDAVLETHILDKPLILWVILGLVVVNFGTRFFAQRSYRKQAKSDDHDEHLSRNVVHEVSNVLLVLASFYFLTTHHHAGIVLSSLVLGLFITDFFEFEAREVELRNGEALSKPNGALVASFVVFLYAGYLSLFFLVEPLWNAVI
ncbi:DUF7313 family protein [Halorussus halophilus]|uniref:DUF7313 family protein n=1 Tax=Halorussus halophilus TaxID=2650975 RepID=UPI001300F346|nr:hypothetical protein [Halorussus halophilus]